MHNNNSNPTEQKFSAVVARAQAFAPQPTNWRQVRSITLHRPQQLSSHTAVNAEYASVTPPPRVAASGSAAEAAPLLPREFSGDGAVGKLSHRSASCDDIYFQGEVVFDEIDETTCDNIVVDCALPSQQIEHIIHNASDLRQSFGEGRSTPVHGHGGSEVEENEKKLLNWSFSTAGKADNAHEGVQEGREPEITLELRNRKDDVEKAMPWRARWAYIKPAVLCSLGTFLSSGGRALLSNMAPFLMTQYYGGDSQEAARVSTTAEAIRAVVALLLAQTYGKLLDRIGRYPFICLLAIVEVFPAAFLIAIPSNPLFYFSLNQLVKLFSIAYWYAYLADHYPDGRHRAMAIAAGEAMGNFSQFFSFLGDIVSKSTLTWIALAIVMIRVPFSLFLFEESLGTKPDEISLREIILTNPFQGVSLLWRSKVLRGATFCLIMALASMIGSLDITVYYLQTRMKLTVKENYASSVEQAVLAPVVLLVVYPLLARKMRPTRMAALGTFFLILSILAVIVTVNPSILFAIGNPLTALAMLGGPALMGIFTSAGAGENQGLRLAGLMALLDVAQAVLPLAMGQMFGALPPEYTWTTFLLCGALAIPCFVATLVWLPKLVAEDRRDTLRQSITNATTTEADEKDPDGGL